MKEPIKILVVDDSSLAREIITQLLERDPQLKVVGAAENGREALELVSRLKPDIITMDLDMPLMDGIEATEQIMAYYPTPILIVTSSPTKGEAYQSMEALEAGALDIMIKPSIIPNGNWENMEETLIHKVKLLSKVEVITHLRGKYRDRIKLKREKVKKPYQLVAIAASTGGPRVFKEILTALPSDFPLGLLLVQHITNGFIRGMADWLGQKAKIIVKVGEEGEEIKPGLTLLAPDDIHMVVTEKRTIHLIPDPPLRGHRPSANYLFQSIASVYGKEALGIILTGMGEDGVEGLQAIKKTGGMTIAQEEKSCIVFGMPRAAIEKGVIDKVLSVEDIIQELLSISQLKHLS